MATVTAPLNSLSASGQVAQTIIFETYKGKTYAKRYAKPTKTPSIAQTEHRGRVRELAEFWRDLTEEQKATWEEAPGVDGESRYAKYLRYNTRRGSNQEETELEWPLGTNVIQRSRSEMFLSWTFKSNTFACRTLAG
jgi:hypothetical protein